MLIVLEGLDGAGKSTQVKRLKEYLQQRCGSLEYIHFPRYEAPVYGDLITRFLKGEFGSIEAVHPQLVALLFAEDLDRYVYSNIAYQCAKLQDLQERRRLRDWIFNTEYGHFELPEPDLNLFLDVPIGFVEQSLTHHREGQDRNYLSGAQDIHEASIAFQQAVRDMYVAETARDPKFRRIDCSGTRGEMLPPDDIFDKIKAAVDPFLV